MKSLVSICLIILTILFSGASCVEQNTTKLACEITSGANGKNEAWFAYLMPDGTTLDQAGLKMCGEGGEPGDAWWIGNNGVGGVKYHYNIPGVWIEDSGVTGEGGQLIACGKKDHSIMQSGVWIRNHKHYSNPKNDDCCAAEMRYLAHNYQGGDEQAHALACSVTPQWLKQLRSQDVALTTDEIDALEDPNPTLPDTGYGVVAKLTQQRGDIENGYARDVTSEFMAGNLDSPEAVFLFGSPMRFSFTVRTAKAINLSEVEFGALVKTNATPDGILMSLKERASNDDNTVHIIQTDMFIAQDEDFVAHLIDSQGDNDTVAIYDRWTHLEVDPNDLSNQDRYFWRKRANWIDCVDPAYLAQPELWDANPEMLDDPNYIPDINQLYNPTDLCMHDPIDRINPMSDPNFIIDQIYRDDRVLECYIVPIHDVDDSLSVEVIIDDAQVLCEGAGSWLSDDDLWDMNGDNIVNLLDFGRMLFGG